MMSIVKDNKLNRLDKAFFNTAMKRPVLTREKERLLADEWVKFGNSDSMHQIINAYSKLVIAASMKFKNYGLPVSDLVQEGHIGLMQAIKKFEPEREIRFSTYASWWIRSAIQDYVLRNWSIVRTGTTASQKALFFSLRRLKNELAKYGEKACDIRGKIADKLNIPSKEVEDMDNRFMNEDKSLNAKVSDDFNQEFGNFILDDKAEGEKEILERIDLNRKRKWFKEALSHLGMRESEIIRLRHLSDEPLTLEKLGKIYSISKERVRQIETRAISKLKALTKRC